MSLCVAVDVGGTHIRAAIYPENELRPIQLARTLTRGLEDKDHDQPPLDRLLDLVASIWPRDQDISVISVAAPGPVNPFTGVVIKAPNIPEWRNLPLRQRLQDRFGVPVLVGNDANLAGFGEWKFGAGQGHHDMLYLTISTGIGSGLIVNDQLLLGHRGLAAELGHVMVLPGGPPCGCGQRGHLEAVASGTAIARWVKDEISRGVLSTLSERNMISAKLVAEAANQGDELSARAFERAGEFIGQALAGFLHIFNPSAVVIGGGVSRSWPLLFPPLRKSLEENVLNPSYIEDLALNSAAFDDEAGLIGALALGRSYYPNLTLHSS